MLAFQSHGDGVLFLLSFHPRDGWIALQLLPSKTIPLNSHFGENTVAKSSRWIYLK
ncbi:unnamed protein product, partial [Larinioides sclopetarius]